jgi:hypothetical protein
MTKKIKTGKLSESVNTELRKQNSNTYVEGKKVPPTKNGATTFTME